MITCKNSKHYYAHIQKVIDIGGTCVIKRIVFLLEDNPEELARLQQFIEERLPVKTCPVCSADAAMRLIDEHFDRFSAFVLDIEIVGEKYNGIQVAEKIRCQPGGVRVPIIFLSSYAHFGGGALQRLHYYDFFSKPCEEEQLVKSLSEVLEIGPSRFDPKQIPSLFFEGNGTTIELDTTNISCIEHIRTTLVVTDLNGDEIKYRIKSGEFENICAFLQEVHHPTLRQVHRSVIINVDRIKKIKPSKNTAMVWLFQVKEWKPIGKTYLELVKEYSK